MQLGSIWRSVLRIDAWTLQVANKLYPLEYVSQSIEDFALDKVRSVVEAQQDAQSDGTARDMMDVDEVGDANQAAGTKVL